MKQAEYSLPADWPFVVKRWPFFYGWVIWFVSTLGIIMSIPGQTMGMAVFTDHFINAFGLSRTELSIAYFIGTLGSSLFLTRAGRFYDRAGARINIVAASIGLSLCLVFIALIDYFSNFLLGFVSISSTLVVFPLIVLGYFGVRFCGQGVLTSASRNVLLVWFEKRRGLVSGARTVFVTLGFSLAPPLLAFLIHVNGWRSALFALAIIVGIGFSFIALVFVRNSPEVCDLLPDGENPAGRKEPVRPVADKTIATARQSPVFWVYSLSLALYSLFGTALIFHIVSIFNAAGRTAEQAFGYFFPLALVSVCTNLLGSWLSDRWPLKRLLLIKQTAFIAGVCGLLHLQQDWGYWLLIAGFGTCSGLWGVLSNLAYIRFFGRLYLGEISGLGMTLTVIGSAMGPVMFSVGKDISGSYNSAIWINLVIVAVLLITTAVIRQEEVKLPGQKL